MTQPPPQPFPVGDPKTGFDAGPGPGMIPGPSGPGMISGPSGPAERPTRTSGRVGLVLALVSILLAVGGVVFAWHARTDLRYEPGQADGLVIGSTTVAWVVAVCLLPAAAVVFGIISAIAGIIGRKTSTIAGIAGSLAIFLALGSGVASLMVISQSKSVFAISEGSCFMMPKNLDSIDKVDSVPCSKPHDAQVFADEETELTLMDFNEDAAGEEADTKCRAAWEEQVAAGVVYDSAMEVSKFLPSRESFMNQHDRLISCILTVADGVSMTGSVLDNSVVLTGTPAPGSWTISGEVGECGIYDASVDTFLHIDCSKPHTDEFVGVITVEHSGITDTKTDEELANECVSQLTDTVQLGSVPTDALTMIPTTLNDDSMLSGESQVLCELAATSSGTMLVGSALDGSLALG